MNAHSSPAVAYGLAQVHEATAASGVPVRVSLQDGTVTMPGRFCRQGFRLERTGDEITVTAESSTGTLYGLLQLAELVRDGRVREPAVLPLTDAPAMRYRGYCLGLQRPTAYYPDHRAYDWPITPEHFPWFYDREHLTELLDLLVRQRCNVLYLWSGHPFASLLELDAYPEMPEVSRHQLQENRRQFQWLCEQAERRGIWVVVKFYNIHMPDPLAKARGWDIRSGVPHPEICAYTRSVLTEFVRRFPNVGLMACMGEVLKQEYKKTWLCDVILPAILDGLGDAPDTYPPVIIRAHSISLEEHLPPAREIYPNLVTMMKHNNESFIATRPDPGNTVLARLSGCHIVNLHLAANLEPFAWGSPRFIRRTVKQMLKAEAAGIHVFPLRYWDWPNSPRHEALGDQLYEHFVWWSAWGRYAWNPDRGEAAEDRYWEAQLQTHFGLTAEQGRALLHALQETGPVLPQIAGQYVVTSGNGQAINLGQFLVPLAFSRQQYQDSPDYSMPQLCGFPLLGEKMWTQSPLRRMQRMVDRCNCALESLYAEEDHPVLRRTAEEIEVMRLLARYYERKSRACARFFHVLYGVPGAEEADALARLEESVQVYRELTALTNRVFRDAASLHHYRRMPLPANAGYLHWRDCLPVFEEELQIARAGGIRALLEQAGKKAKPNMEWNAASLDTDEV